MKTRLIALALLLFTANAQALVLYTYTLTRDELQASVAKKFPFKKTKMKTEVTLTEPNVILVDGSKRFRFQFRYEINPPMLKQSLTGTADVDGELRYKGDSYEFFVDDPQLLDFTIDGNLANYRDKISSVLLIVAREWLAEHAVYKLNPSNIQNILARWSLIDIRIDKGIMAIDLGI